METIIVALGLAAIIGFVVGLVLVFRRAMRKYGLITLVSSFVVFVAVGTQIDRLEQQEALANDQRAQALGFLDHEDQVLALSLGFPSDAADSWALFREERERERAEEERRLEAQRLEEERLEAIAAQERAEEERRLEEQRLEAERLEAIAAQQRADEERRAQIRRQAAERRAAEAALEEERRSGFHCLSDWDGSHRELARAVIDSLNDPGSFSHVETRISPVRDSGNHGVIMKFRAKNAFGALILSQATARIRSSDCSVIDWSVP